MSLVSLRVISLLVWFVRQEHHLERLTQVRCLLGFVLKGLVGASPDKDAADVSSEYRSGVYLLTAQLGTKLTFTKKVRTPCTHL